MPARSRRTSPSPAPAAAPSLLAPIAELRAILAQFGALKKLAYEVQGKDPPTLSAEWDGLRGRSEVQYIAIEATIGSFLGSPGERWQPRFKTYYVLPVALHLLKLAVFCSSAGIIGVLCFDVQYMPPPSIRLCFGAICYDKYIPRSRYWCSRPSPYSAIHTLSR